MADNTSGSRNDMFQVNLKHDIDNPQYTIDHPAYREYVLMRERASGGWMARARLEFRLTDEQREACIARGESRYRLKWDDGVDEWRWVKDDTVLTFSELLIEQAAVEEIRARLRYIRRQIPKSNP